MRYLVLNDPDGGMAFLTTESAVGTCGVPVLRITAADVDGDFGPADVIGDLSRPETLVSAAEIVAAWAAKDERSDAETEAARRFCAQWPEGPQVAGQ